MKMSFKYMYNALILLFVLTFSACKPSAQETPAVIINERIGLSEAKDLMKNEKNLKIIDVRTPEEFNNGHLEKAVNIDFRNPGFESKISALDRDEAYLIYCKSGGRSGQALEIMKELDFKNVKEMRDGYSAYIKNN